MPTAKSILKKKISTDDYSITKNYIPTQDVNRLSELITLYAITDVLDEETDEPTGLITYDKGLKDVMGVLYLVDYTTNLKVLNYVFNIKSDDDVSEFDLDRAYDIYDDIMMNRVFNNICKEVVNIDVVDEYINHKIHTRLESHNSVSNVISKGINKLVNLVNQIAQNLPSESTAQDIMEQIPSMLNGLDNDKADLLKRALGQSDIKAVTDALAKDKDKENKE